MTARTLPSKASKPEKTLEQKWDDWERRQRMNSPSDEEIARAVASDPDAAPILTADEMRRQYKPRAPRRPR